ncbi:MAG TPA: LptE family protein [Sphingobacteriaceae bacterium]
MKKVSLSIVVTIAVFLQSCGIYKFSGASIPLEMRTVTINFFENNAPLVVPYLSQLFTEALKDRIRTQSRLSVVRADGDGIFEGRITDYSIAPVAVTGNQRAGLNRLTITVSVKYTNAIKADDSFEQSFTRYKEFDPSRQSIPDWERELIPEINRELTEDIFNRAFANW